MLIEISRYMKTHNLSPTRFGIEALNDPTFVSKLRNGREIRPSTMAKLKEFMS